MRLPAGSALFPYTTLFRSRRGAQLPAGVALPGWAILHDPETMDGARKSVISPVAEGTSWIVEDRPAGKRSEEHTSELQSQFHLVCRLLLEKKKTTAWTVTQ